MGVSLYAEAPDANAIVLVKAGSDPSAVRKGLDAAVSRLGLPSGSVEFKVVPKSRAELFALHARVDALLDEMGTSGAVIDGTGPDYRLGKIQIDIESGQDAATRVLGDLARDVHFVKSWSSNLNQNSGALPIGPWVAAR